MLTREDDIDACTRFVARLDDLGDHQTPEPRPQDDPCLPDRPPGRSQRPGRTGPVRPVHRLLPSPAVRGSACVGHDPVRRGHCAQLRPRVLQLHPPAARPEPATAMRTAPRPRPASRGDRPPAWRGDALGLRRAAGSARRLSRRRLPGKACLATAANDALTRPELGGRRSSSGRTVRPGQPVQRGENRCRASIRTGWSVLEQSTRASGRRGATTSRTALCGIQYPCICLVVGRVGLEPTTQGL